MNMREKIARAIDPGAFASWQHAYDYEMRKTGDTAKAAAFADWAHSTKSAFEKADAVLDALMEPTEEMQKAGEHGPTSTSYGGDDGSFEYVSDDDAGEIFQLMIRAAKEGK